MQKSIKVGSSGFTIFVYEYGCSLLRPNARSTEDEAGYYVEGMNGPLMFPDMAPATVEKAFRDYVRIRRDEPNAHTMIVDANEGFMVMSGAFTEASNAHR